MCPRTNELLTLFREQRENESGYEIRIYIKGFFSQVVFLASWIKESYRNWRQKSLLISENRYVSNASRVRIEIVRSWSFNEQKQKRKKRRNYGSTFPLMKLLRRKLHSPIQRKTIIFVSLQQSTPVLAIEVYTGSGNIKIHQLRCSRHPRYATIYILLC